MYGRSRIVGSVGRAVSIFLGAVILATALSWGALAASAADTTTASPKVRELMTALAQEWLKEQGVANAAAAAPAQQPDVSFAEYLNSAAGETHDQIIALASAIPDIPHEFERTAARITAIDPDAGRGQVLLDVGIFGDPYMIATRRRAAEAQVFLNLAVLSACGFGAQ